MKNLLRSIFVVAGITTATAQQPTPTTEAVGQNRNNSFTFNQSAFKNWTGKDQIVLMQILQELMILITKKEN